MNVNLWTAPRARRAPVTGPKAAPASDSSSGVAVAGPTLSLSGPPADSPGGALLPAGAVGGEVPSAVPATYTASSSASMPAAGPSSQRAADDAATTTGPGARAPERPVDEGAGHRPTVAAAAPPTAAPSPGPSSAGAPAASPARAPRNDGPAGAGVVATALRERFWNLKRSRIRRNPPSPSSRASSIGEACERRLFYERTVPADLRIAHEPGLQAIFDLGNEVERYVLRELEDAGIEIVQRGRDHLDRDLQLSGHVDALIRIPEWSDTIPAEIKGLNPYTAGTIETERDIREHPQKWVQKYYWQLQAYLRFERKPLGMFVLMDKTAGVFNFVPCVRDDAAIAEIEAKAIRIRDAVRADAPLARRPGKDCERCPFLHVCAPDRDMGKGVLVVDDPELESALARRAELEEAHREFTAADKVVKAALKANPAEEMLVGDFVVRGKETHRGAYSVAASSYWQFEIESLRGTRS